MKQKYYRVYDEKGQLKRIIDAKQEKHLTENEWIEVVSCFVINENGEVLIEKRANRGLSPGELDLCSGHIDNDETPTQAMIRELGEELGIGIEDSMNVIKLTEPPMSFEVSGSNIKRNFFATFYCLKGSKFELKLQEDEVEKVIWLPLEKVFELIRSGKTRFPMNYDYEQIFQKVRDIQQGVNKKTQER